QADPRRRGAEVAAGADGDGRGQEGEYRGGGPGRRQRLRGQAVHGRDAGREAEQDLRETRRLRYRMNATDTGMQADPTDLIQRIASLTRMLRDSMRELGLDQAIKDAAEAIPDARDRLRYVAQMTEQAANRVLNA